MPVSQVADIEVGLLVHDVPILVRIDDPDIVGCLEIDYGRFIVPAAAVRGAGGLEIVAARRDRGFAPDGLWAGPGRSRVAVTAGRATVAYASRDPQHAYETEVRPYLTTLLSRHLMTQRRAFMFHASAVSDGAGQATLFVGQKGAGKTTMALSALSCGAGYMANDLVFVEAVAGGLQVLAMPQPPRFGVGTLESLRGRGLDALDQDGPPARAEAMSALDLLTYAPVRKLTCDPKDLPQAPLRNSLRRIVFPWPDFDLDAPVCEPMPPKEAAFVLVQQCRLPFKPGLEPQASYREVLERLLEMVDTVVADVELRRLRWSSSADHNLALLGEVLGTSAGA